MAMMLKSWGWMAGSLLLGVTAGVAIGLWVAPEPASSTLDTPKTAETRLDLRPASDRGKLLEEPALESEEDIPPVKSSPALAVAEALMLPDRLQRFAVLTDAIARMTPSDAAAIGRMLFDQPPGPMHRQEISLFLYAWGRLDPQAALRAVQDEELGREGRFLQSIVMSGWAEDNPTAAMAYAQEADTSGRFDPLLFGAVSGWAASNPSEAAHFVAEMDDSRLARMLGRRVFEQLAATDPMGFAVQADRFTNPERQAQAYQEILQELGKKDRAAANQWLLDRLDRESAVGLVENYAGGYAQEDPSSAIRWAEALPDNVRGDAFAGAIRQWAQNDLDAAAAYLDQKPSSPEYDAAVRAFVPVVASQDLEAAAHWIPTIEDPAIREQSYGQILPGLLSTDPEAALRFIEEHSDTDPVVLDVAATLLEGDGTEFLPTEND